MLATLAGPARTAPRLPGGPVDAVPVSRSVSVAGSVEVLVHTWDPARAAGGDETPGPAQAAPVHAAAEPFAAGLLATGAFGPPLPPPAGADARTRVRSFPGRRG
ncbi:hypothetical protein ACQP2P_23805 [Dactylosporangium sp. CA-139114]|uniref:hypothetical protein n=1 Tax=Dactylosporangium sp. CA-139114 TaxID=3239931 RepID=UPI003D98B8D5